LYAKIETQARNVFKYIDIPIDSDIYEHRRMAVRHGSFVKNILHYYFFYTANVEEKWSCEQRFKNGGFGNLSHQKYLSQCL